MADFSADKQALQKTLTTFDTGVKVEDVIGFPIKHEDARGDFLLHTLLDVCCRLLEHNPKHKEHMYLELLKSLVHDKVLKPTIQLDYLDNFRNAAALKFILALKRIRSSLLPDQKDSSVLLGADLPHPDIYEQNFEELKVIAEGGFGTVCMAVHKVDRHIYAVKKVIFECRHEKDYMKVMSEVKSISALNHRNVVSYKNCWIQLLNIGERTGGYPKNQNFVPRQSTHIKRKKKTNGASILSFPDKNASCWPCPKSSKVQKSHEDNLLKPENLLHQVLSSNIQKSRISECDNASNDSWSNFVNDTTSELNSDQSIICNSFPDASVERSISASSNTDWDNVTRYTIVSEESYNLDHSLYSDSGQNTVFCNSYPNLSTQSSISELNDLCSDPTSFSEDDIDSSGKSLESDDDQSIVFREESSESDFDNDLVFACTDMKCSVPNTDCRGCSTSTPMFSQTPELHNDQSTIFGSSYAKIESSSECSILNTKRNTLNNEGESADISSSRQDQSSELEESIIFCSEKSSSSAIKSIWKNGDFNRNVSVLPTSKSRLSISTWDEMTSKSNADSVVVFDSNINNSVTEFSGIFRMKFTAMLCIQMEYCNCDLRLWLDQKAKGEPLHFHKEVKDIFKDIVKGVAHIHLKCIIHRDLKPQNIFYSEKDNSMKIGDFGLATLGHSSPNRQRVVYHHFTSNLGTYPYIAPEQKQKHNYNEKVDIYSLGIILIELLLPFQTHSEFFLTIPRIINGDMPEEIIDKWPCFVELLKNLVQRNPSLRMSAKEILELPVMEDDAEVDRRHLLREISDLKKALEEKDKKFESAMNEKNATIEALQLKVKQMANRIKNLKSKKSRKKN